MSGAEVQEVPDGFLVVCPAHNLIRGVATGQHAANLQALHNRVDHADDTDSIEVDLTAAASVVVDAIPEPGSDAWDRAYAAGARHVWERLTGIDDPKDALAHAREIAAGEPLTAAVAPF